MTMQGMQILLQSVSSLAIAVSLVYAAIQFRESKKAAHVANFSKLVELQMQLRRMRVDDPSIADVHQDDVRGVGSPKEIQNHFLNLMQLSLFEIAWFSHKYGQIPDDYFESWVHSMKTIVAEESFRKMIENPSMKIMHDDFRQYVMGLMREVRSGATPPSGAAAPRS